jgi:putative transposase-like DNA-binding protein
MGHARCDRAVRLLHQASSSDWAGAGSRGWTSPVQDTPGVSHSRGHTRRHQFQPGIITEPLGSLTVILVHPAYTSIDCHICGTRCTRPRWDTVVCPAHGELDADLNGARNLATRAGLGSGQASVA